MARNGNSLARYRVARGPLQSMAGKLLVPAGSWAFILDCPDAAGRYLGTGTQVIGLYTTEGLAETACRSFLEEQTKNPVDNLNIPRN